MPGLPPLNQAVQMLAESLTTLFPENNKRELSHANIEASVGGPTAYCYSSLPPLASQA